jgi:hypothetical protein
MHLKILFYCCRCYNKITDIEWIRSMNNIPGIAGFLILRTNLHIIFRRYCRLYMTYWNIISPVISPVELNRNYTQFLTFRGFEDTGDILHIFIDWGSIVKTNVFSLVILARLVLLVLLIGLDGI